MPHYVPKDSLLSRIMPQLPKPVGCLVILAWMIVLIPVLPFHLWRQSLRRNWLAKRLAEQGRFLSWTEFLTRTSDSPGTVVIEVGNKLQSRFWWTAEKILSQAPTEPPKYAELNIIFYGGATYHPFSRWCYENYLAPDTGTAFLVSSFDAGFETFPFDPEYDEQMKQRFPNQDVVILTFYDTRFA